MVSSLGRNALAVATAIGFLTACGGSGGVPNATSSLEAAQSRFGKEAGSVALSGEYIGKLHDGMRGRSRVKLLLSQSQSALGGIMVRGGASGNLVMIIAWNLSANTVSGNGVGPPPGGGSGICTFSMTGTRKFRRISGSYNATYGCSGESGTFALWHKCNIPNTGSEAVRPESGIKPC